MRLVENFAKDWNNNILPLMEIANSKKIVEADGKEYPVSIAYEVPIWRLGEKNLNGRTYSKELAEKVIKEGKKTFCLKDHPQDDGSVDRIVAIAENPHIKENVFYADAYFVDEDFENKIEKIVERGMGLGVSSSALGDLDESGNVLVEGFEIERYFDFVINPSYQVYLTKEGRKTEEIKDNTTNIKEDIKMTTNTVVNTEKEKKKMADKNKTLSIEEKNLRLGVKNLFEKAESKGDLQEKVDAYKEVLDYCDGVDIAEDYVKEATDKISEIQTQIYELANKGKEVDSLKESTEKTTTELTEKVNTLEEEKNLLAEKYDRAIELLESMKEREKKIKELYEVAVAEKNGMVTAGEYKELQVFSESQEKEIEELKEEITKLKKRIRSIMEKTLEKGRKKVDEEGEKKKDDDDEDEMDPEDEKGDMEDEEKEDKKEESQVYDFRNSADVEYYYEDLVGRNPNVKKIKKDILNCKTLFEAQRTYFRLRDLVEDDIMPNKFKTVNLEENKKSERKTSKLNVRKGWV